MKREFLNNISGWSREGILSIIGPTGSGKTSIAQKWVRENYAHEKKHPLLVSVDSVAVYKELNIGTAKPSFEDLSEFCWAGLNLCSVTQGYTAADFVRDVLPVMDEAVASNRPVILVGGSHFYERALVEGMSPGVASDKSYQESLEAFSNEELRTRLILQDSKFEEKIHLSDRFRICRFLDLVERQGLTFEELFSDSASERSWNVTNTLVLGLDYSQKLVWNALESRVNEMLESGLVNEVRTLVDEGVSSDLVAFQAIGYRETLAFLNGRIKSEKRLCEEIYISHRQLAKKQRTWLRGLLAK